MNLIYVKWIELRKNTRTILNISLTNLSICQEYFVFLFFFLKTIAKALKLIRTTSRWIFEVFENVLIDN